MIEYSKILEELLKDEKQDVDRNYHLIICKILSMLKENHNYLTFSMISNFLEKNNTHAKKEDITKAILYLVSERIAEPKFIYFFSSKKFVEIAKLEIYNYLTKKNDSIINPISGEYIEDPQSILFCIAPIT